MKNLLSILFAYTALSSFGQVDCFVSVNPLDTTICPGDSVFISATASVTSGGQSFNFNGGVLPAGWSTTGSTLYSTPCGPGPNGSPYFWASTSGAATPTVTTASFDVSCGGSVVFEMMYATQGGAAPCEGPDLAHEGVELQYSTNGGVTWIPITYFSPGGYQLPSNPGTSGSVATGATPYTVWNQFIIPIPPGAMTQGTMFQWIQQNSSGTCCDNWGLENISIQAGPCASAVVNWSNGFMDTTSFYATPVTDTVFIAYVYDTLGVLQCISDSIFVNLNVASLTYNLVDTVYAYCPTDTIPVQVMNMANSVLPYNITWSTGSTTNPTDLWTNGIKHDTIVYYVEIEDGCGFLYNDSVVMVVNQTLNIDTLIAYAASACAPDGAASAFVSGTTTVLGQPFYNWTGPGNPGPLSVDATVITNAPSGWYYFSVEDDVCQEMDSVFIDMNNPPMAAMTPNTIYGCAPLQVTFTNESQNTTNYVWNFGGGNVVNANNLSPQSATFMNTTNVMLIASDNQGCADTAYVTISVDPCGCTDPEATNYNPFATIDDGSCFYPNPTVVAPNIFTPNNDGDNDDFFLTVTNTVNVELVILNRWGGLMYESSGPNPAWNGETPSGAEANEGTYFYKYLITGIDGSTLEGHGFLQLVRD